MVTMPPGHAKSTYCSEIFPAYFFARHEQSAAIAVSHTSELAERFGRKVRNLVQRESDVLGYTLQPDSKAAGRWETTQGGEYIAMGIGGGITGRRADLIVIDDPVKGRTEAHNDAIQNKVWEYYTSELYTRLKPDGRILLVMTRWSERDLGGRLIDEMGSGGDKWVVLNLPAIAEDPALSTLDNVILPDQLGRAPGEALWPEWEDADALLRKRITVGELDWSALFQQRPRPPKGVLFDVDKIVHLGLSPVCRSVVRSWDIASTSQIGSNDPDWTVGVKLGRNEDGKYVVLHVERFRGGPMEVESRIVETAKNDGRGCKIRLPQDPGAAGVHTAAYFVSKLPGYTVTVERETGSKETRATPMVSQVNVGNLGIAPGEWNRSFIAELRDFPNGRKDDQVDALSGAFAVVGMSPGPMRITSEVLNDMRRR